jgi:site-specific DNA-methyltransferase (adenine-specific)
MIKIINGTWQNEVPKIESDSIDLIIIDPPYLVTKEKWDKDEVVNDELSNQLFRIAKDSCSLYVWCGIGEKSQSLIRWFPIFSENWYFKDLVTWKKQRGMGMRKGWLYTREEIMWFVKDNNNFVWNKENQYSDIKRANSGFNKKHIEITGKNVLRFSNIWTDITESILGNNGINLYKNGKKHYTPKPEKAIERIILAHTKENDTVLDCFLGSGTTAKVCKDLNRNCIGIEKEEEFCKLAEERIR